MRFADPYWLVLLLVLVPMWWRYRDGKARAQARVPSLGLFAGVGASRWRALRHAPFFLRALAVTTLVIALARPQAGPEQAKRTSDGLDIVLILDTSRSMEARDFVLAGERPTRLEVVKKVISDFIAERPNDRIGMVVFGTEAFTQAPLTLDHELLLSFLSRIQIGMAGDATAIGDGLVTAVNRLKDIDARSRVAILLTDGGNTAGRTDPLASAQAAKAKGVKVYTIGVGSKGNVPVEIDGRMQTQKVDVDTELLEQVASTTGGRAYMASDTETLVKVYDTIDKLEKTRMQIDSYDDREEIFAGLALAAMAFLMLELGMGLTRYRTIP